MDRSRKATIDLEQYEPPYIPCRFIGPDRLDGEGNPASPLTQPGSFNGFILYKKEGKIHRAVTNDYALGIAWDGYCEIPRTKSNKAALKKYTKPQKIIRKVVIKKDRLTGRIIKEKEVTITVPPIFEILPDSERRGYDPGKKNHYHPESPHFDIMRPWAKPFIKVPHLGERQLAGHEGQLIMDA